jgi:beta-glucosidase
MERKMGENNMNIDKLISELTLEEKAGLCSGSDFWHTKAVERFGIPKAMMCDGPHGLRKQKGEGDHLGINESIEAVCFPSASALAASFDRDLLYQLGEILGDECQAEEVAMLLGPGINIKRSPLCGRNFEYFSEDPYLTGQLAASYVKGLQGKGIAACVKHFAANNQETRRMSGSSQLDERTLHEIYLPAFETVVKEGKTQSIMCSYNQINGTFSAENKLLLTDILKDKWGYDGFVVTDWGAVKDRVKGLLAGLDLEMPGGAGVQDHKIVEAVKNGTLDEAILNNAVRNILTFVSNYQNNRRQEFHYDILMDHMRTPHFAKECAVLLKNEHKLLPISTNAKVAFIGKFAEEPRYQGAGSSFINVPHAISALEAASTRNITYVKGFEPSEDVHNQILVDEAVEAAKTVDIAVIFAGLTNAYESEGADRSTMKLPDNQNKLIEAVAAVQPNLVVVLHGGSPVEMPWINQVPALLNMYLGGDGVGAAAVALLYGDANPCGKLAESFPIKLSDNPSYLNFPGENGVVEYREGIYVGYRYYDKKEMEVLFPFGHGLSYTSFVYSTITLDKTAMLDTDTLSVSCNVKNIGDIAGKEIIQLYVRDLQSTVGRPIRELKDFVKLALAPGEEKTVTFVLNKRSFAYYEPKLHDWFVESGSYAIEIGASSRDIRLSAELVVEGTTEIPMVFTKESTIGNLMKIAKGRAMINTIMEQSKNKKSDQKDTNSVGDGVSHLGEGSEKAAYAMMLEMPLCGLVSFGRITQDQLDQMLEELNS